MIISASRRTDIPNYYSEWFLNRLIEGYVCVRNPMNIHRISKIPLSKDVLDGIVFWTKNPEPMLKHLDLFKDYPYYFQFTVNAYGKDLEPNVPNKSHSIIPTFCELSRKIGNDRVIWRYDPIIISQKYTIDYHIKYFNEIAERLTGYTKKCIISFVDLYRNTKANMSNINLADINNSDIFTLALHLNEIAQKHNIVVETCAEKINLEQFGIKHGHCIDKDLLEKITGYHLILSKDKNQREECGCFSSIDIGMYNSCQNGCKYCYANFSEKSVRNNVFLHDANSPLLSGYINEDDIVTERKVTTCKDCQMSLFNGRD